MADDEEEYHPLVGLVWGAMFLLVGCGVLLYSNNLASQIDVRDRCAPRESGRCFTDESGIVVAVEGDWATIRHDDGRRTADLQLTWDADEVWPKPRTRIRLEHWDGALVSLVDASNGRRYRTSEWPERWHPFGLISVVLAGFFLIPTAGWFGVKALMRAVRSDGKLGQRV